MASIYEIRRDNLRLVVAERGATSVAKACGYKGPSYISQMAGTNPTRPIMEDNARKFETGLGLTKGWLDIERDNYGRPLSENSTPPASLVPTSSTGGTISLNQIDVDRFTMVAKMVRDAAGATNKPLSAHVFKEIVALAYDEFSKDSDALREFIDKLVKISG